MKDTIPVAIKASIKIVALVILVPLLSSCWNNVTLQTTPNDTILVNKGDTIRCDIDSWHVLRWCAGKSHTTWIDVHFKAKKSRVLFGNDNVYFLVGSKKIKCPNVGSMYDSTYHPCYLCFFRDSLAFKKTDTVYFKNIKFVSANDTSHVNFSIAISEKSKKSKK